MIKTIARSEYTRLRSKPDYRIDARYDASEAEGWRRFEDDVKNQGLFAEKRRVVLVHAEKMKKELKKFDTLKDVEIVVVEEEKKPAEKQPADAYALGDAIMARAKGAAIVALARLLETEGEPHRIIGLLAYQTRTLLSAKTGAQLDIHPYPLSKAKRHISKFELAELAALHQSLAQLDVDAKSGTRDLIDGLYQVIFAL